MKKEGNKGMPTPKQKLIHNPIPTPLFVICVYIYTYILKLSVVPAVSSSNNRNISKRNKDVGMGL